MFLIQPQQVFDEAGRPSLQRKECSFDFLFNYVASRTAELMERHMLGEGSATAGRCVQQPLHTVSGQQARREHAPSRTHSSED